MAGSEQKLREPAPCRDCLPGQPIWRPHPAALPPPGPGVPQVLPGGGRAVGTAADTSPSGLPRGRSPSASLPCWTTTQRVTYLTEPPGAAHEGARLHPSSHRAGGLSTDAGASCLPDSVCGGVHDRAHLLTSTASEPIPGLNAHFTSSTCSLSPHPGPDPGKAPLIPPTTPTVIPQSPQGLPIAATWGLPTNSQWLLERTILEYFPNAADNSVHHRASGGSSQGRALRSLFTLSRSKASLSILVGVGVHRVACRETCHFSAHTYGPAAQTLYQPLLSCLCKGLALLHSCPPGTGWDTEQSTKG